MGSQAPTAEPAPLPQPSLSKIATGINLLEPLSRKGEGPGLIILTELAGDSIEIRNHVPSAFYKWAEEGYAVVQVGENATNGDQSILSQALEALKGCRKCDQTKRIGLVSYSPKLWNRLASSVHTVPEIVCAVAYDDVSNVTSIAPSTVPVLLHLAGRSKDKLNRSESFTAYDYPANPSHLFATPFTAEFDYNAEGVSHTRSLTHLKRHMNGPYFDLEAIWEEHTYWEFGNRSVEHTMATMVQEPYVNHVPTMTGGIGRKALTDFYTNQFIFANPADTELELISRTVGIDRVIDEFIFKLTHDCVVPWLVPGIPPTHKRIAIPMTSVVNIRGDRLYHEHIAWDQATVLNQLGLLPEYLPYVRAGKASPDGVPGGDEVPLEGQSLEYRLPVAGIETAEKLKDKNGVVSNQMFQFQVRKASSSEK